MNKPFGNDDPRLESYVARLYGPEDAVLREIRDRSTREGLPDIQVAALDALHLELLVRASGVRRAVEIGTLGGYSGVAIARGLLPGGRLDTCELEPLHARVAEESFRRAGVADRVRIHLGPALASLRGLEPEAPFDFVFIDADKEGYPAYLDWAARCLRPGGVLVADNVFAFGGLAEPIGPQTEASVRAMDEFHRRVAGSGEFRATVLPTGEGLSLAVRM